MRAAVIIIVALNVLLFNALTIRSPQQQALFSDSLLTKLKTSTLGRAIFLLAEVHGKQDNTNFDKLFDSLEALEESFQTRIETENQEYSNDSTGAESDRQFYQNQVDQYETEVAQQSVDIRALSQQRDSLESSLQNKKDELSETNTQRAQLQYNGVVGAQNFKKQTDDFNSAIIVIDKAIALLQKARDSSFIETNKDQYTEVAQDMHNTLTKMYQPIAQMFVQIASQGFADQQNLNKAIKLLQNLRDSLNESRMQLSNAFENEVKQNQELLDSYQAKSSQLADVIIVGLLTDIDTKLGETKTKQALQSGAQGNLDAARENLNTLQSFAVRRDATHTQLILEYTVELGIVEETVSALNAGGISRND